MPIFTASMMSFGSPRQQAKCSSVFFPAVVMAVWETGKGFLSLKKVSETARRIKKSAFLKTNLIFCPSFVFQV